MDFIHKIEIRNPWFQRFTHSIDYFKTVNISNFACFHNPLLFRNYIFTPLYVHGNLSDVNIVKVSIDSTFQSQSYTSDDFVIYRYFNWFIIVHSYRNTVSIKGYLHIMPLVSLPGNLKVR